MKIFIQILLFLLTCFTSSATFSAPKFVFPAQTPAFLITEQTTHSEKAKIGVQQNARSSIGEQQAQTTAFYQNTFSLSSYLKEENSCAFDFQKLSSQIEVKVAQISKKERLSELENRARVSSEVFVNGAGNFAEYIKNGFKINASTLDDAFKHVDDVTLNGAGKPTFNSNRLVGCHNEINFIAQRVSNGGRIEVISETQSVVTGVKNIEYKTLQTDNAGNPIAGQYVKNGETHIKTVYDPNVVLLQ